MMEEFADALEEAGYDVVDVSETFVAVCLHDVGIRGVEFDEVELTINSDPSPSGDPVSILVDVWRGSNDLSDANESVLEEVGIPEDDDAVYVIGLDDLDNHQEIRDSIREVHPNL